MSAPKIGERRRFFPPSRSVFSRLREPAPAPKNGRSAEASQQQQRRVGLGDDVVGHRVVVEATVGQGVPAAVGELDAVAVGGCVTVVDAPWVGPGVSRVDQAAIDRILENIVVRVGVEDRDDGNFVSRISIEIDRERFRGEGHGVVVGEEMESVPR